MFRHQGSILREFITTKDQVQHVIQVLVALFSSLTLKTGDRGSTVVKVLCYKSEGRGSIPDGVTGIFY